MRADKKLNSKSGKLSMGKSKSVNLKSIYDKFKATIRETCDNDKSAKDYLVKIFYEDNVSSNKDLLWETYGEDIFKEVLKKNSGKFLFPIKNDIGDFIYEGNAFKLEEVDICSMMKLDMEN